MIDYTFELATEEDFPHLVEVDRSAVQKFIIYLDIKPPSTIPIVSEDLLRQSQKCSHLWVVRGSGFRIGFLAAMPYGDYTHFEEVSISLPFQGMGIGRRFIQMVIDKSFAKGQTHITLTTDRLIPWNYPFYKTFGFEEIALEDCPDFLREILLRDKAKATHPENRIAMILDI